MSPLRKTVMIKSVPEIFQLSSPSSSPTRTKRSRPATPLKSALKTRTASPLSKVHPPPELPSPQTSSGASTDTEGGENVITEDMTWVYSDGKDTVCSSDSWSSKLPANFWPPKPRLWKMAYYTVDRVLDGDAGILSLERNSGHLQSLQKNRKKYRQPIVDFVIRKTVKELLEARDMDEEVTVENEVLDMLGTYADVFVGRRFNIDGYQGDIVEVRARGEDEGILALMPEFENLSITNPLFFLGEAERKARKLPPQQIHPDNNPFHDYTFF
ncbi:hypothetical protein FRB99_006826 [Tulasnella sp. 403]|nr:hypothetical protein FRB99_006826 [Tulasnella sp. 403]